VIRARSFASVLLRATFGIAVGAAVAETACSSAPADDRIGVTPPDRTQFDAVGKFLVRRCGELDCHGARTRNLQIFGCEGLRLDEGDTPRCRASGGKDTTSAELDATYRSLVGLEPAVMSSVVQGSGAHPELLTFVRKARGAESHKGGVLIVPGDSQDTCITSWLAGTTDTAACDSSYPDITDQVAGDGGP
jgi:hypothetical protein